MRYRLILISISLIVFGLVLRSSNSYAGSDPKFTLLVSQSLVDNGTIRLDAYRDDLLLHEPVQTHIANGTLFEQNGHLYNFFPTGPSIFTLPIVAVLRLSGMDMRLVEDIFLLQRILAALTCVLMVWIVYGISRCFLDETSSLIISAVSVLGTTIISSMGTALWTINFSTIFIGLSVLLISRYESGKTATARPIILGLLLFLAYFSRASSAAFIIAVMAYLLVKERRQFLITAITSLFLLLIFMGWSRLEYGTWLPAYYSVARLQTEHASIWIGLLGNLLSPSRGIFIFSPFFLLIIPGVLYIGRKLIRQPIVWFAASWFILSLLLNARAVVWWGGDSFGPRLLTENILALVLLVIVVWREARRRLGKRAKWLLYAVFAVLSLTAIFINSYQGLYNPDTIGWNLFVEHQARPPTSGLGDLFDWENPQFFATASRNCEHGYQRYLELLPYDASLENYQWGDPIWHYADQNLDFRHAAVLEAKSHLASNSPPQPAAVPRPQTPRVYLPSISKSGNKALLVSWLPYNDQLEYRMSICPDAQLLFKLDQVDTSGSFEIALSAGALGEQDVRVSLNGTEVGAFVNSSPIEQPDQFTIRFDGTLLKANDYNEISFEFPSAIRPNPRSYQMSALAFYWASIYPVDRAPEWVVDPQPIPLPTGYP